MCSLTKRALPYKNLLPPKKQTTTQISKNKIIIKIQCSSRRIQVHTYVFVYSTYCRLINILCRWRNVVEVNDGGISRQLSGGSLSDSAVCNSLRCICVQDILTLQCSHILTLMVLCLLSYEWQDCRFWYNWFMPILMHMLRGAEKSCRKLIKTRWRLHANILRLSWKTTF